MKNKIFYTVCVVIGLSLMAVQVVDVSKLKEEYTLQSASTKIKEAQVQAVENKKELFRDILDDDSEEITDHNYSWLKTNLVTCGPNHAKWIRAAFTSHDMITENEYHDIISKCVLFINSKESDAKAKLRESVQ